MSADVYSTAMSKGWCRDCKAWSSQSLWNQNWFRCCFTLLLLHCPWHWYIRRQLRRQLGLYFVLFHPQFYHFILPSVLLNLEVSSLFICGVSLYWFFLIILQQCPLKCFLIPNDVVFGPAPFVFNMGSAIKFRSLSIPDHTVIGRNSKVRRRTRTAASRRGKY